ncbi:hypothetical protein [Nocardia sp. CA-135398]|uniref:hypothetical protein n=1 Tax=Nocardia sp. CA-135398 TaxID=3239977 RepID=UPI003D95A47D
MTAEYSADEVGERVEVGPAKTYAAGIPGVLVALQHGLTKMGPTRTARTLGSLNHATDST